jgi:hypothetical protein
LQKCNIFFNKGGLCSSNDENKKARNSDASCFKIQWDAAL